MTTKLQAFTMALVLSFFAASQGMAAKYSRRTLLTNFQFSPKEKIRLTILDADSTLRAMYLDHLPAHKPEHVVLLPLVAEKIRQLNSQGIFVAIMSNQSDIGKEYSLEDAESTFSHTIELLEKEGAKIDYFDFAEFRNGDRKPRVGMASRLAAYLEKQFHVEIDWAQSEMVGDAAWMRAKNGRPAEMRPDGRPGFNYNNFDRLFAVNLGIRFIEAPDFFDWRRYGIDTFHMPKDVEAFYEKQKAQSFADPSFDRMRERKAMLELASNLPETRLEISLPQDATPENLKFVQFFKDHIWPRLYDLKKYENLFELWMVINDRALSDSAEEKEQWSQNMIAARKKLSEIHSDPQTGVLLKQWAEMVTAPDSAIKGELADFALQTVHQMELEAYPEEAKPLLDELSELEGAIQKAKNEQPKNKGMAQYEKTVSEAVNAYFNGAVTFDSAWQKIESVSDQSRSAMAQDLATFSKQLFNRAAVLRSKIAKLKGYANWSELILARQAKNYAAGSRTPAERVAFLNGLLGVTKDPYLRYLEKAASTIQSQNGPLAVKDLRASQLSLLTPTASLIREYFPKEDFQAIWRKTMIESGASPEMVNATINIDAYPRDGKQTHAYMANLSSHKPSAVLVDAKDLKISFTDVKDWKSARIFIVQNNRDDGPGYLSTIFHEGGHALDYSHRENPIPTAEEVESSNSYSETHSMTMEKFIDDPEFLVANGKTRNAKPLPRALAEKYVANANAVDIVSFRRQVASARYDIELWNYDYDAPGALNMVDRAHALYLDAVTEASQLEPKTVGGVDPGYAGFSTDHFFSGQVRYIGYVFAGMAARLNGEHLLDVLERQTGRRTLYQQPTLVPTLVEGYYKKGFSEEFPKPVENFLGKKYSPQTVVNGIVKAVEAYVPEPVKLKAADPCKQMLLGSESKETDKWDIQVPETD